MHVLFNSVEHSSNFKKYVEISSTSLYFMFVLNESFALFIHILCFCIEIWASDTKSLIGSFNHLYSFTWKSLNAQTGWRRGQVEVLFLNTGLELWLSTQASSMCSGNQAWSPALDFLIEGPVVHFWATFIIEDSLFCVLGTTTYWRELYNLWAG
jgi:hypothetical protein